MKSSKPSHRRGLSPLQRAVQFGYLPLMLLGFNGAAVELARRGASALWLVCLLAAAIAVSFLVEHVIPYRPQWNQSQGDAARDVVHALVNESLNVASVAVLPLVATVATLSQAWPGHWPFAAQVFVALLVLDLGVTLAHIASHHVGWLWRFHAVHHSVKRLYGFNGLMKHPLHQLVELAAGVTPLLLVGLPLAVAEALAFCVAVQLLLQHSNADYATGPFGKVLALNTAHRFHHLKWAGVGDVNFGLVTLLWDRLFGTYKSDPQRHFSSDDLGIAKLPNFPARYVGQLAAPFVWPAVSHAAHEHSAHAHD